MDLAEEGDDIEDNIDDDDIDVDLAILLDSSLYGIDRRFTTDIQGF